jgi:hypothetical protein
MLYGRIYLDKEFSLAGINKFSRNETQKHLRTSGFMADTFI